MEAIRCRTVLEKEGEITLTNLPYHIGQSLEVIVLPYAPDRLPGKSLTAKDLLHSDLFGMWKDRTDITDASEFVRSLRTKAWVRRR